MEIKDFVTDKRRDFSRYGFEKKVSCIARPTPTTPTITDTDGFFTVTADEGATILYRFAPATTGVFSNWQTYIEPIAVTSSDTAELSLEFDIIEAKAVVASVESAIADEGHFVRPILRSFTADEENGKFVVTVQDDTEATELVLEYLNDSEQWVEFHSEQNPTGTFDVDFDPDWLVPTGEITVRAYTTYSDTASEPIKVNCTIKSE